MARCGCTLKCNCVFKEGICTEVGIGISPGAGCVSPTLIYSINVKPDNQTVLCGANGLTSSVNTLDTNTIDLSGIGSAGNPLKADVILTPDGNVPDPDALGTGNLIKEIAGPGGGIYVSCEDVQDCIGAAIDVITADCLNYDDATNTISIAICNEPNGIECVPVGFDPACPAGGLAVLPSNDANNSLTFGTDNRLYAPAAAVAAGDCMTFTGTGTQADPFIVTPQVAPEQNGVECVPGSGLLVTPSSDPDNFLVFGGDTRLYVNRCPLVNAGSQVLVGNAGPCFELTGGTDCTTPLLATLRISDDVCQGLQCRADGLYVEVDNTQLPFIPNFTSVFGPIGPFNGFIPYAPNGGAVIVPPTCLSITNPSPCRTMFVNGLLTGFVETGRTRGRFRVAFDISESGNPAGPYFSISQVGQSNPEPASRSFSNAIFVGGDFPVGPGATKTECIRIGFNANNAAQPVVNGFVFSGSVTFNLQVKWAK